MKKCIDSLLRLDYPKNKYEIFVVDAFSTDGTYEILKSYGKKIKLFQVKGWPPTAYNWAIKRIKSDYTALIDADCVADRNWIKELVLGFKSKEILAVAGFCGTPRSATGLQRLIGKELEDRFNAFPEYIQRAPTMNLCFLTKTARRLKFDETLKVGYDTDFGYRLTKEGKMLYSKKAIIYHYHRAAWKNFFKQQYTYAKTVPLLYSKKKANIGGDNISKPYMPVQIAMLYLAAMFALASLFNPSTAIFLWITSLALFISYFSLAIRLSESASDVVLFMIMFFFRNIAWNIGIVAGVANLLR
jgi:glycosyltransferase involved in cell wall biosynthesis